MIKNVDERIKQYDLLIKNIIQNKSVSSDELKLFSIATQIKYDSISGKISNSTEHISKLKKLLVILRSRKHYLQSKKNY